MENNDDNNSFETDILDDKRCWSFPLHSKRSWATGKSLRILVLCSSLILVASGIPCIQWPFVILYFENQGAKTIAISAYVSCMSVFLLITSLFSRNISRCMTLQTMLILSVVLLCGSTCLHGLIVLISNVAWQLILGVVIRAVQGVTATMLQVLAVAILIQRFPDKSGRVSAVNETSLGLGFSLFPFIGGVVYDKVGFLLTFVLLGGVGFLMILPLLYTSYKHIQSSPSSELTYADTKWKDALFLAPLAICAVSVLCETCVDFVIALYVNDMFGEDATLSGALLSAPSLASLFFSFIFGYFCDKFNPFLLGVAGCLLTSLGFITMVPPPFLHSIIKPSKAILIVSTVITGVGQAMIWLHVLPAMLFVKTKCRDTPVNQRLSSLVSLLYIVATSAGEIAGSFIAGGLHVWVEYWTLFTILSGTMLLCVFLGVGSYIESRRCANRNSTLPTGNWTLERQTVDCREVGQ